MSISTQQVRLEDLSEINYEIHIGTSLSVEYLTIMILKFSGSYGFGSSGNCDAAFMSAIGKAALEAWSPDGLIIDLSELYYEWGDQLERVFFIGSDRYIDSPFPVALLVGAKCEEAVRTLLLGINSTQTIKEIGWVFTELEEAWSYIEHEKKRSG